MAEDKPATKKEPAKKASAKDEPAKKEPAKQEPDANDDGAKKPEAKPARFDPKPVNVGGESILERLLPHVKKIAIGAAVAIGIVMIGVLYVGWKDRKARAETTKVVSVVDTYDQPIRPAGQPVDPNITSFGSAAERATKVLDTMAKEGGKISAAFRGAALVQAGKLDDAIAEFKRGQDAPGLDGVLAREGLGLAYEAKAVADKDATARQRDLEDALAAFKAEQPDDKGERAAYALYHQARILAQLGKRDDAKAMFNKAKDVAKDTDLPPLIEERLVSLGGG